MANRLEVVMVVYDPPSQNLPFLSAIFVSGREPMVTAFETAGQAEQFNKFMAVKLDNPCPPTAFLASGIAAIS